MPLWHKFPRLVLWFVRLCWCMGHFFWGPLACHDLKDGCCMQSGHTKTVPQIAEWAGACSIDGMGALAQTDIWMVFRVFQWLQTQKSSDYQKDARTLTSCDVTDNHIIKKKFGFDIFARGKSACIWAQKKNVSFLLRFFSFFRLHKLSSAEQREPQRRSFLSAGFCCCCSTNYFVFWALLTLRCLLQIHASKLFLFPFKERRSKKVEVTKWILPEKGTLSFWNPSF